MKAKWKPAFFIVDILGFLFDNIRAYLTFKEVEIDEYLFTEPVPALRGALMQISIIRLLVKFQEMWNTQAMCIKFDFSIHFNEEMLSFVL